MQRSFAFLASVVVLQFSSGCGGESSSSPGSLSTGGAATGGAAAGGSSTTTGGGVGTGGASTGTGGVVEPPAGEAPTAVEAAAAMGRGFNLGQMFENTQHPRTFEAAKAKIDAYYDRGFRNVRIPVTWTEAVDGDTLVGDPTVGDVKKDHPRLAVITQVIDYAFTKPGLYVVLNAHHEHALKTNARSAVLERLWQDIVSIFGDRDYRLLFEILNEPHKDDTSAMAPADLRLMTGLAYAKIRAVNPKRIVLIGGNQWFGANEIPTVWKDLEPVGGGKDLYLMAEFHHYSPWTFCGDNQGTYADAWTDADMAAPMNTMKSWAETVGGGMPVYIGEWGVGWGSRYATMDCNNIRDWYTKFDATQASSRGQPTAVWDDGGWFEIFDHTSGTFGNNLVDCIEGECEWTGTERFNSACE